MLKIISKMVPLIYYRGAFIKYGIDKDGNKITLSIYYHIQGFKWKVVSIDTEFDEETTLNQLIKASKIIIDGFNDKYTLF